ncbi:hypothetical protein EHQ53_10085 [Leptospira langatensis]|uniref:Uncharacterized protein n=1 Tax=Leptospira langatensis TaxID=2484983 RepID=A0A5F1ZUM3_9LEPT|nr:hypothetical protein [Leptospira langatensis]TGK00219.1 hypothetical protein EHO57_13110 [Leptospira langatensis]TGL41149.1 hypothetical protein EHQ53_10085 [Leptospira langatensis]
MRSKFSEKRGLPQKSSLQLLVFPPAFEMRLRNIILLLLPISSVWGRAADLPNEFLLRPWWSGGEISVFGISGPGNPKEAGAILQVPFWKTQVRSSRFVWVGGDRTNSFSQIFGLGHRIKLDRDIGLEFQLLGSPGESGFFLGSLGAHTRYVSLDFLNRRSSEGTSIGALLRSDPNSAFRLSLSYERTKTNAGIWEDKISLGFTWGIDRFLGDAQFQEKEKDFIGYASLGFSPFPSEEKAEEISSDKGSNRRIPNSKKEEQSYPSLETEELLKYGFSIGESLEIAGHSRQSQIKFKAFLGSLPEAKRRKIEALIRKKRGLK